jgi:hypothetical protein
LNSHHLVAALEHERELLREFYALSEKQLLVAETDNLQNVGELLDQRRDLMLQLSVLEANLSVWIDYVRFEELVSINVVRRLRSIRDDIVALANAVVDVDERTNDLLDLSASSHRQPRVFASLELN